METKLKMQRKNQILLANMVLLAALLFNIFIAHSSKVAVYAGVALLLFVNVMFVVESKRGAAN